jgi:hypothetical protein
MESPCGAAMLNLYRDQPDTTSPTSTGPGISRKAAKANTTSFSPTPRASSTARPVEKAKFQRPRVRCPLAPGSPQQHPARSTRTAFPRSWAPFIRLTPHGQEHRKRENPETNPSSPTKQRKLPSSDPETNRQRSPNEAQTNRQQSLQETNPSPQRAQTHPNPTHHT